MNWLDRNKINFLSRILSCTVLWSSILLMGCDCLCDTPSPAPRPDWIERWLKHEDPICQPPCYENIIPGQTTIQDAEVFLRGNNAIEEMKVTTPGPGIVNYWEIGWKYNDLNTGGRLVTNSGENIVTYLVLGFPANNIVALDEIIAAYGSPSHVVVWTCSHGPCVTDIVYIDIGMGVGSLIKPEKHKSGHAQVKLTTQTEITKVYYFEPGMDGFKRTIAGSWVLSDDYFHSWNGYQLYSADR